MKRKATSQGGRRLRVRFGGYSGAAHLAARAIQKAYRGYKSRKATASKPSYKKSASHTRTITRRKKKVSFDNQLTHGSDTSFFFHRVKGKVSAKKMLYVSAKHNYRYVVCSRLTCNVGFQGVGVLGADSKNNVPLAAGLYGVVDLTYIWGNITTVQSRATANTNVPYAVQFAVPVAKAEYLMTNSTDANLIMYLYDVVPRRTYGNASSMYNWPDNAWKNGMDFQQGNETIANNGYNVVGSKPFDSKAFCENWRVMKVSKVTMAPGALHRHIVKTVQRRWMSDSLINNTYAASTVGSELYWLGGRTILTMCVIYGAPAHSHTTPDAAHVSTTAGAIDIVCTKSYEYLFSATAAKQTYQLDALPAPNDLEVVPEGQAAFVNPVVIN